MPSYLMDGKHGRTMSGVECHHRLWEAHTIERRRACHAIIALGRQTPSTTSGVACHHRLWAAETVEQCQAWHVIIAFERQTRSIHVRRDMPSLPLDSTHCQTTPGMSCHHRLWAAQTVEQCRAWHAIIALERQTRSNDVRRDMPSPPLDSTHGR